MTWASILTGRAPSVSVKVRIEPTRRNVATPDDAKERNLLLRRNLARLKRLDPEFVAKERERCRKYRERNKEKLAAYAKAYKARNAEKLKANRRLRYELNKEQALAQRKAWAVNHREHEVARAKAWDAAHPEETRRRKREYAQRKRAELRAKNEANA